MKDIPTKAAVTGDLVQLINQREIGRFHFQLLGLCAAVVFMDGFDAQAIGYVAPSLSQAWHLAPGALGPVFGAGLFGIMLGALVGGPVADYLGRKRVIIFAALFFGICTLITAVVKDVQQLLIIRFITGLGLGAAMPNAIALISEYSPKRRHAIMVMAMFCGFSLGAALGGLVAGLLVPRFGWPSVFVFGGVVPLLLVPLLAVALPESVRFLLLRNPADPAITSIVSKLGAAPAVSRGPFTISEEGHEGFTVPQLFTHGRALATVLALDHLLHESAQPLFPFQLAADGSSRYGDFDFDGSFHKRAVSGRRNGRSVSFGLPDRSIRILRCTRRHLSAGALW